MRILKEIAQISSNIFLKRIKWEPEDDDKKLLGILSFKNPVIDLRKYGEDGAALEGVVFTDTMIIRLAKLIVTINKCNTVSANETNTLKIVKKIGEIRKTQNHTLELNVVDINSEIKYDIRYWDLTHKTYTPGINLNYEELGILFLKICDYIDNKGLKVE